MVKDVKLLKAKDLAISNLDSLRMALMRCVDDGMIDPDDHYYNEILDLLNDVEMVGSWDELMEAVTLAKILETDVGAWLSRRGSTSLSLTWPKQS